MDFVLERLDKPWFWISISSNPGIKMEDISLNTQQPWSWWHVSANPNLTIDFIKSHPDILDLPYGYGWNWIEVSRNNTFTIKDILNNLDLRWKTNEIMRNSFTKDKLEHLIQHYRRHLAAFRIQQHWHRIRLDPRHPVGQRRLEREYDDLFG